MIILWSSEFDGVQVLWQLLAGLLLLVSLLPGSMALSVPYRRFFELSEFPGSWLNFAVVHIILWILLLFSLTLGPSAGMMPKPVATKVHTNMEDMLVEASQVVDQRHLFGRGGIVGDLQFAGFRNLEVQGNVEEPLFAYKRRYSTVSFAVLMMFHLSVYLCAVMTVAFFCRVHSARILWFSVAWSVMVYAPAMHWVWGEGWLFIRGAIDEGGSLLILIVSASILGISRFCRADADECDTAEDEVRRNRLLQQIAVVGFVVGYLVLMSSIRVPVAQVRAAAVLNGILSACGGYFAYSFLKVLLPSQAKRQSTVMGLCCGVAAVAAGCTMFDPRTAMTCGVLGGVAGFSAWSVASRWRMSISLQFPVATSIAAAVGLLFVGLCGTSATGVLHWNREIVSSLIHGETHLLKQQAITVLATLTYVLCVSVCLGQVFLGRNLSEALKTK